MKINILRTVEEIENIKPIWQEMQSREKFPIINADIDRYLSVLNSTRNILKPYIMVFTQKSQTKVIVIGYLGINSKKLRLGYLSLSIPKLSCLTVAYGGILGHLTDNISILLIEELLKILRKGEVDMVSFNHLKTDSYLYKLTRKKLGILTRNCFPKIENHWQMLIPDNLEQFYKKRSKKHRSKLKSYIRKLEQQYPNRVRMVTFTKETELDEAIKAAYQISLSTYQYGLGHGLTDDLRTRTLLTTAARQNWLYAHILYIDEEPSAFRIALKYGRKYFANGIGFNPKWKKYGIGTILFLKVIERLCQNHIVDYYDFGFGPAEYKASYGDKQWKEASVHFVAPRFYPVLMNLLSNCTRVIDLAMAYVLNKAGLRNRVKRLWRNTLQKKPNKG